MKKVYIVIPAYNVEKYISKCLDTVFSQTYLNTFVICVDDGSIDSTLEIMRRYKKRYEKKMELFSKPNGGPASARNLALSYLKNMNGDSYITFIDGDDWVETNYIEKLVDILERNDVDVVCSSFFLSYHGKNKPYKNIEKERVVTGFEATELLILDETIQSHTPTKMYKSRIWRDLFFDESILFMEDQAFLFNTLYVAKKVFISNYTGYYYRQDNPNSLTKQKVNNKKVLNGLYAYYSVCRGDYDEKDAKTLLPLSQNALVAAYLMLIPYYKKRDANKKDKIFIKNLKKYIKNNSLLNKYIPNNKNNAIKKRLYMCCPPLYPIFFKLAKRISKSL